MKSSRFVRRVCVVAAIALMISSASAQTNWTGTSSDIWSDGTNWDAGVPGDAVIGNTGVARDITNAGGTISGFTWNQSSAVVSQITLGSDLNVTAGPRVFNNTSGSAANMVLDLNGHQFRSYSTVNPMSIAVQSSAAGGTFEMGSGSLDVSGSTIGPGVTVQATGYNGVTIGDNPGSSVWDPTSLMLGRVGEVGAGITVSGAPRFGNVEIQKGKLIQNGGMTVQGDVLLDSSYLGTDGYGAYDSVRNQAGANSKLRVGGNWTDTHPDASYSEPYFEHAGGTALHLTLDGGGNVQTVDINSTNNKDVHSRLTVDDDSYMELASNFISTYDADAAGIIESSLNNRSTVDLGTWDLDIAGMNMYAGSAGDAPTIIYGAGADSGTFTVGKLIHANWMDFIIEDAGGFAGGDLVLLSYNSWTGIKDFSAAKADVTMPAGWSYDSLVVSNYDGGPGTWTLTNVVPEPMTMSLLLVGGLALMRRRR